MLMTRASRAFDETMDGVIFFESLYFLQTSAKMFALILSCLLFSHALLLYRRLHVNFRISRYCTYYYRGEQHGEPGIQHSHACIAASSSYFYIFFVYVPIQTCDATYPSSCDGCVLRNGSKSRGG